MTQLTLLSLFLALPYQQSANGRAEQLFLAQRHHSTVAERLALPEPEHFVLQIDRTFNWLHTDWGYCLCDKTTGDILMARLNKTSTALEQPLSSEESLTRAKECVIASGLSHIDSSSIRLRSIDENEAVFDFGRKRGPYAWGNRTTINVNRKSGDVESIRFPIYPFVDSEMTPRITVDQATTRAMAFMAQIGNPHAFVFHSVIGPKYTDEHDLAVILDKPGNQSLVHGFSEQDLERARQRKAFLTYRIFLTIEGQPNRKCSVVVDAVTGKALYDEGSNFVKD